MENEESSRRGESPVQGELAQKFERAEGLARGFCTLVLDEILRQPESTQVRCKSVLDKGLGQNLDAVVFYAIVV